MERDHRPYECYPVPAAPQGLHGLLNLHKQGGIVTALLDGRPLLEALYERIGSAAVEIDLEWLAKDG